MVGDIKKYNLILNKLKKLGWTKVNKNYNKCWLNLYNKNLNSNIKLYLNGYIRYGKIWNFYMCAPRYELYQLNNKIKIYNYMDQLNYVLNYINKYKKY